MSLAGPLPGLLSSRMHASGPANTAPLARCPAGGSSLAAYADFTAAQAAAARTGHPYAEGFRTGVPRAAMEEACLGGHGQARPVAAASPTAHGPCTHGAQVRRLFRHSALGTAVPACSLVPGRPAGEVQQRRGGCCALHPSSHHVSEPARLPKCCHPCALSAARPASQPAAAGARLAPLPSPPLPSPDCACGACPQAVQRHVDGVHGCRR